MSRSSATTPGAGLTHGVSFSLLLLGLLQFVGLLQQSVDLGEEQGAAGTVAGAVVGGQARVHRGGDPDPAVDDDDPLRRPSETDDGHLRVDDPEDGSTPSRPGWSP